MKPQPRVLVPDDADALEGPALPGPDPATVSPEAQAGRLLARAEPIPAGEVTLLLHQMVEGRTSAAETLMPMIYDELRRIARSCMRRERPDHTLQPTALVHEAFLRLAGQDRTDWQSRGHFYAMAARMMRRILVDSSRSRLRNKRGSGAEHQEYIDGEIAVAGKSMSAVDLLALDEALEHLAEVDGRMVKIVEMRYFAGLGNAEIAEMLGISEPTVKRSWSTARAWLARYLSSSPGR